ncbi:MAG: VRR-NUC domain-containing protein [Armatimonadota bacterium]
MTKTLRLTSPKEPDPPEAWHQEQIFRMAELNKAEHPELADLFHPPNGGFRHKATGAALKRQGEKAGIPDIYLDHARGGYFGLRVELKRFREGVPSDEQKRRLLRLQACGYRAVVAYGWRIAWAEILRYLSLPPTIPTEAPPSYNPIPTRREI